MLTCKNAPSINYIPSLLPISISVSRSRPYPHVEPTAFQNHVPPTVNGDITVGLSGAAGSRQRPNKTARRENETRAPNKTAE